MLKNAKMNLNKVEAKGRKENMTATFKKPFNLYSVNGKEQLSSFQGIVGFICDIQPITQPNSGRLSILFSAQPSQTGGATLS